MDRHKRWSLENKDKENIRKKKWREDNSEYMKSYYSQWRIKNPNYNSNYRQNNRDKHKLYERKRNSERYNNNVNYKLASLLRTRIRSFIKNGSKTKIVQKYIGCSFDELKIHIESKFKEGMTWENHGVRGWHIDHIIPLSSFDLTKDSELKVACHYTNLQPLWATENLKKGNKLST